MKATEKVRHHLRNFIAQAKAVTDPGPYAGETDQVIDRPNYLLTGLKAPHVYGFPDQHPDVRIAAHDESGAPRRVQRNHSLHYSPQEYKPMTMELKFRSL